MVKGLGFWILGLRKGLRVSGLRVLGFRVPLPLISKPCHHPINQYAQCTMLYQDGERLAAKTKHGPQHAAMCGQNPEMPPCDMFGKNLMLYGF